MKYNIKLLKENFQKFLGLSEIHSGPINYGSSHLWKNHQDWLDSYGKTFDSSERLKSLENKFNSFPITIDNKEIKDMLQLVDLFNLVNYGSDKSKQAQINKEIEEKTGFTVQDFKTL